MRASAPALVLSVGQKSELEGLVRNGSTPQKVALRCRLLLLAHDGVANQTIAEQLSLSRPTVLALREAFEKNGVAAVTGIRRRKRAGSVLTPELERKIVDTTVKTRPGDGSTHWTVRMLAAQLRISRTIVHRVWQRHDIQPHRVERFKLSNDPHFEEKVRDIVGLYLNPPERALVLCVDEKSQIQALDRADPASATGLTGASDARLQTPRHHDSVRRLQYSQRQSHRHLSGPSSQQGIHTIPQPSGNADPRRPGSASDHGQLLHPQERTGPAMATAEKAKQTPLPFHPHQQFLAQSGGAVLRSDYRQNDPSWNLSLHR